MTCIAQSNASSGVTSFFLISSAKPVASFKTYSFKCIVTSKRYSLNYSGLMRIVNEFFDKELNSPKGCTQCQLQSGSIHPFR